MFTLLLGTLIFLGGVLTTSQIHCNLCIKANRLLSLVDECQAFWKVPAFPDFEKIRFLPRLNVVIFTFNVFGKELKMSSTK